MGDIKRYSSTHLYIVDDYDRDAAPRAPMGRQRPDPHRWACDCIDALFRTYTNTEVHSVRFPAGTTEAGYFKFWQDELATKTKDDLIIIYYHGNAGEEDEEYSWRFSGYPKRELNAYELIRMINQTETDCLMLLDCNIQTRFTEKQKKLGRKTGHTEILARGQRMQESNGKVKECDGDFTDALVSNLQSLIEDLNAGKRKGTTKPARTKAGGKDYVFRLYINPDHIRSTGKMDLFCFQIQGGKEKLDEEEDEGIADMSPAAGDEPSDELA